VDGIDANAAPRPSTAHPDTVNARTSGRRRFQRHGRHGGDGFVRADVDDGRAVEVAVGDPGVIDIHRRYRRGGRVARVDGENPAGGDSRLPRVGEQRVGADVAVEPVWSPHPM
jgi:hypothetical protein